MTDKALVALDQGTSSTRAIVFGAETLEPLFTSQRELPQHYPQDGWVEHDVEDIWRDVERVLGEAADFCASSSRQIAALGITNQRETVAVWDRDSGKPLHRAIVWQDRRTAPRCAQLAEDGAAELVRAKTGLVLDPYFSATKLDWLLDKTGARERAARGEVLAGTIDALLVWRLTRGRVFATDVTNASRTQLCSLADLDWDEELLSLHNVPRACLPEVRPCTADFGVTGLLGGEVPILGIAGDQQAAAIGQACLAPGATKSTYGTGCFVIVQGGAEPTQPVAGLLGTVGYQIGDRLAYAMEGSIFVAGVAVKWLRDQLGVLDDAAQSAKLAAGLADNGGVYMVPAFTGLGAPHWNPAARAAVVGMTLDTGRAQLARAALEANAYQTQDLVEQFAKSGARPQFVNVDGGMAANDWFAQFLADTIDMPVSRPACVETTAVGAAFLAGLQAGVYSSADDIARLRVEQRRFEPAGDDSLRQRRLAGWRKAVGAVLAHAAD